MVNRITIRPFEQGDLDKCAELYVRVFSEPPWGEEWTLDHALAHLRQTMTTPGFEGLVAIEGESIVGVLTGNRKCTAAGDALLLDDMYVDSTRRGQGIGTRLMEALKARLAGSVTALALFTQRTSRAADFYRSYGFVEDPDLRFMLFGLLPDRPERPCVASDEPNEPTEG
jgi:GNAT superfamily N-acetyltransferase